ncbi:MAG: formate transporter FocA [Anaerolineae bacterium]|nr:formate transporter FocA [Anaerolineae bacterium]
MAQLGLPQPEIKVDAFAPAEMAARAEAAGVKRTTARAAQLFAKAILAGAFISLGGIYSTVVLAGTSALPYGVQRLLGGLVFCLGLILVVVGGAELFTGNALIVMAWATRKITTAQVLRNWAIVYLGNFAGSLGTAGVMFLSEQYTFGGGAVGLTALSIGNGKCALGFVAAVALGIMCNLLVCLAVWLCFSARSTTDKILAVLFPISAFVAAGFEHSVANMYFIPVALFIKSGAADDFWTAIGKNAGDFSTLTWGNLFLRNLLPVTLGNIIGGALLVGGAYWFIYLRKQA